MPLYSSTLIQHVLDNYIMADITTDLFQQTSMPNISTQTPQQKFCQLTLYAVFNNFMHNNYNVIMY